MILYKLKLSDNSFYIVDENFKLVLHKWFIKKRVSIKQYINSTKYNGYYLIDVINNQKITRAFELLTPSEAELQLPHNVRIKYAKDIRVNDLVLGANHEPERVTELHNGTEQMYDINVNGTTYTVNEGHVLELVNKDTNEHLQMQVGVYVNMDDEFKSHYVMEVTDI